MALLTLIQQQAIKPISSNWANHIKTVGGISNFVQLQIEVENLELRKLLGYALLYNIQQNPTDAKYIDLLDGKEFTDCNDNTVKFNGIRYQLAYMNWSKYVSESHFADTFGGMVQKNRTESTALSNGDIKRTQLNAQEIAISDFNLMKIFLDDNTDIYDLWECNTSKKVYTPKFLGIKKTIK